MGGQTDNKPMKKGFATLIAIIIVFVAITGSSVLIARKTTYLDAILPSAVKEFLGRGGDSTSSESSTETPSEDPTKDWKTYTNADYGFSFKYPADWIVYPGVVGGLLDHLGNYIVDLTSSPKDGDIEFVYPGSPVRLRVIYVVAGYKDSLDELVRYEDVEQYVRDAVLGSYDSGPYEGLLTHRTLGGRDWVEIDYAPDHGFMLYTQGPQKSIYGVYLPKDLGEGYLETVELVLSSLALSL